MSHESTNSFKFNSRFEQLKEEEFDLRSLFNLVKFNLKFVLMITLAFFLITFIYVAYQAPKYQAVALIKIESNSADASNLMSALGMMGGTSNFGGLRASPADIETAILRTPYIMQGVVEALKLNISVVPKHFSFLGIGFTYPKGRVDINELALPDSLLNQPLTLIVHRNNAYTLLDAEGSVLVTGKVGVLSQSTNPDLPIRIMISNIDAKTGEQFIIKKQPAEIIEDALAAKLLIQEQGMQTGVLKLSYTSNDPVLSQKILATILAVAVNKNIGEKSAEAAKTLNFLNQQLPGVRAQLYSAETALNTYRSKNGSVGMPAEGSLLLQQISMTEQSLEKLRLKKLELLQKFTSQHPLIISINQKEKELQNELSSLQSQLRQLPLANQQAMNLESNLKIRTSIYTSVLQNMQQLQMLKGGTVSDVRILSTASYPLTPLPAKRLLLLIFSIMLGFIFSIFVLLLKKTLSAKAEHPDVVEQTIGVPVFSIVSYSKTQARIAKKIKYNIPLPVQETLLASHDPNDLAVESLRSLRTALKLQLAAANGNVISITGCSPGIGKSFISTNLAFLFSELNLKVLLVDADLRKGYACKYMQKQKSPGLTEYLQGKASLEQIIQPVFTDRLSLIATGAYPEKAAELLMNADLDSFIKEISQQFDIVFFDTPPILAVTDATFILKQSNINLMVVGVGKDQLKELEYAKRVIERAGTHISGMVFNNLSPYQQNTMYGSYNYQYSYQK